MLIQIFTNPNHFAKHQKEQDLGNYRPCLHGSQSREDGKQINQQLKDHSKHYDDGVYTVIKGTKTAPNLEGKLRERGKATGKMKLSLKLDKRLSLKGLTEFCQAENSGERQKKHDK